MPPVDVATPVGRVGHVLEEQVVGAVEEQQPVWVVQPPGLGREMHPRSDRGCRHPFTPLEAMLPMNRRWKARNSASTGRVISVE